MKKYLKIDLTSMNKVFAYRDKILTLFEHDFIYTKLFYFLEQQFYIKIN